MTRYPGLLLPNRTLLMPNTIHKTIIKTTLYGPTALVWARFAGQPQIVRIIISNPTVSADQAADKLFPNITDTSCPEIDAISSMIKAFFNGEKITFSLERLRLDTCSDFQKEVLQANYGIVRGSVSSYNFLASHLGRNNAARAVGTALATNPFPIMIPCHRVIRSDRTLGGFGGGLQMKRALLEMEGVTFDKTGQVTNHQFHYQNPNQNQKQF